MIGNFLKINLSKKPNGKVIYMYERFWLPHPLPRRFADYDMLSNSPNCQNRNFLNHV